MDIIKNEINNAEKIMAKKFGKKSPFGNLGKDEVADKRIGSVKKQEKIQSPKDLLKKAMGKLTRQHGR